MATQSKRIADLERQVAEMQRELRRATARLAEQPRFRRVQGVLQSSLGPASNATNAPTTAQLNVYRKNAAGNMEATGETVTVVCRYTEIGTLTAGRWMRAEFLDGEWSPYAPDCGPTTV